MLKQQISINFKQLRTKHLEELEKLPDTLRTESLPKILSLNYIYYSLNSIHDIMTKYLYTKITFTNQ